MMEIDGGKKVEICGQLRDGSVWYAIQHVIGDEKLSVRKCVIMYDPYHEMQGETHDIAVTT